MTKVTKILFCFCLIKCSKASLDDKPYYSIKWPLDSLIEKFLAASWLFICFLLCLCVTNHYS